MDVRFLNQGDVPKVGGATRSNKVIKGAQRHRGRTGRKSRASHQDNKLSTAAIQEDDAVRDRRQRADDLRRDGAGPQGRDRRAADFANFRVDAKRCWHCQLQLALFGACAHGVRRHGAY